MPSAVQLEASEKFRDKGIRFQIANPEHEEKIWKLLCDSFFLDDPISRSIGLHSEKTFLDRLARKDMRGFIRKECLTHPDALSIVAIDSNDEVVAAMLGYTVTRDKKVPFMHAAWMRPLYPILPKKIVVGNSLGYYYENVHRAHPLQALEELGVDKMCQGEVLVVSRNVRGLGLGKEVFRLSVKNAKERKCGAYFSVVSGIYSQRIAHDLEFETLREFDYEDFRDHRGKRLLKDTLEHKKMQVVALRL